MPSKEITDLTPFLQRVFFNFRAWVKRVLHKDIVLVCAYRNVEEQQSEYAKGRTRPGKRTTNCDGVKNKSNHNYRPSRAFDFSFMVKGKLIWDKKWYDSCWLFFRQAKLTEKVRWGRNWKNFKDYPHIEEV